MLLSKHTPLCEHHSRLEELLAGWGLSLGQTGAVICNHTRGQGKKSQLFLQADRKELRLHGVLSARICSLPDWLVQICPYVLQTLSRPLDDLATHRFSYSCLLKYLGIPKTVQSSVVKRRYFGLSCKDLLGSGWKTHQTSIKIKAYKRQIAMALLNLLDRESTQGNANIFDSFSQSMRAQSRKSSADGLEAQELPISLPLRISVRSLLSSSFWAWCISIGG